MKKLLSKGLQKYFRHFPVRTGKIPILLLFGKLGLFKNVTLTSDILGKSRVILNLSDWVQQLVYFFGIYEFEKNETKAWIALNEANRTVLDIGANFGYYSLISASISETINVIAFEPAPETFRRLSENILLNNYHNVIPHNLGVSDRKGNFTLYIANDDNSGMSGLSVPDSFSGTQVQVDVIQIDEFLGEKIIKPIKLVKIDVEGNELNVLKGMNATIENFKPVIFIELIHKHLLKFGHSIEEVFEFIHNKGYALFEYEKNGNLIKLNNPKDVELAICIHASMEAGILSKLRP